MERALRAESPFRFGILLRAGCALDQPAMKMPPIGKPSRRLPHYSGDRNAPAQICTHSLAPREQKRRPLGSDMFSALRGCSCSQYAAGKTRKKRTDRPHRVEHAAHLIGVRIANPSSRHLFRILSRFSLDSVRNRLQRGRVGLEPRFHGQHTYV